MTTIHPGTYSFTHFGYNDQLAPSLTLLTEDGKEFRQMTIRDARLTLRFDTAVRRCTGWHDLATGESHPCPDNAILTDKYHECRGCMQKTGFNPAFYNAVTVSSQQQARNQLPHILYLAHFGPGVVKVGISWADRGIRRLLDQGARSYVRLATLPTADIARQYEAKIAHLPGIVETVQSLVKIRLLNMPYNHQAAHQELDATRQRIIRNIGLTVDDTPPQSLDSHYLGSSNLQAGKLVHLDSEHKISGQLLGMIGSVVIAAQDDTQYYLPIGKLRGYTLHITDEIEPHHHAPQQATLF